MLKAIRLWDVDKLTDADKSALWKFFVKPLSMRCLCTPQFREGPAAANDIAWTNDIGLRLRHKLRMVAKAAKRKVYKSR